MYSLIDDRSFIDRFHRISWRLRPHRATHVRINLKVWIAQFRSWGLSVNVWWKPAKKNHKFNHKKIKRLIICDRKSMIVLKNWFLKTNQSWSKIDFWSESLSRRLINMYVRVDSQWFTGIWTLMSKLNPSIQVAWWCCGGIHCQCPWGRNLQVWLLFPWLAETILWSHCSSAIRAREFVPGLAKMIAVSSNDVRFDQICETQISVCQWRW